MADGGSTNGPITIWTYDWVPGGEGSPRGFVRDLRLRWACEEAGFAYDVRSVPFDDRGPDHFARQPFGQVPFLEDEGITIFESGAGLLHLAEKSGSLMPREARGRAETLQWTIAGLNSVEMIAVPWWFLGLSKPAENPLEGLLVSRLDHLEAVLAKREWLADGRFTVADILMADVLRLPWMRAFGAYPATDAYVARATDRPSFRKAVADQIDHFARGDASRFGAST